MDKYLRKSSMGEDILLFNIAIDLLYKNNIDVAEDASVDEILLEAAHQFFPSRKVKGFGLSCLYFYAKGD